MDGAGGQQAAFHHRRFKMTVRGLTTVGALKTRLIAMGCIVPILALILMALRGFHINFLILLIVGLVVLVVGLVWKSPSK